MPDIIDAGVLHLSENLSDHCPIFCVIKEKDVKVCQEKIIEAEPKPSWKFATEREKTAFFDEIDTQLSNLTIPSETIDCKNIHCKHTEHRIAIDDFVLDMLHVIEKAALEKLPTPKISKKNSSTSKDIPRWKEDILPYRKDALFWNAVWISAGKPLNTELHMIMKRTRNLYHMQIRKNKRFLDRIKKNAFLNSCINGQNGIYKEIKTMQKCRPSFANTIDGKNDNIPELFADNYRKLYNSVDDKDEMERMKKAIRSYGKAQVKQIRPSVSYCLRLFHQRP